MSGRPRAAWLVVTLAAVLFWSAFAALAGVAEPWDAPHYPAAFVAACLGAALAGYGLPDRAWRWGVIVVLAQLPVMLALSRIGPLVGVGVLLLAIQCLPAMLAAAGGAAARRWR